MIQFIKLAIPALVFLAIVALNSATMSDIAKCDWFDKIVNSSDDDSTYWGNTSPLFDYRTAWKTPETIAKELVTKKLANDELSAALSANTCKMCHDELIEIYENVKKGDWFKHSIGFIQASLAAAQTLWDKAVKAYFKDGIVQYKAVSADPNKNKSDQSVKLPFGPWVIWSKCEWIQLNHKWCKDKRQKQFLTGVDMNVINPITKPLNLQSIPNFNVPHPSSFNSNAPTQRGRTRNRSYSEHKNDSNDRSRSRDYDSSSYSRSNTNNNSNNSLFSNASIPNSTSQNNPSYSIPSSLLQNPSTVSVSNTDKVQHALTIYTSDST